MDKKHYRLNLILDEDDRAWLQKIADLNTNGNLSAAQRLINKMARKRPACLKGIILREGDK